MYKSLLILFFLLSCATTKFSPIEKKSALKSICLAGEGKGRLFNQGESDGNFSFAIKIDKSLSLLDLEISPIFIKNYHIALVREGDGVTWKKRDSGFDEEFKKIGDEKVIEDLFLDLIAAVNADIDDYNYQSKSISYAGSRFNIEWTDLNLTFKKATISQKKDREKESRMELFFKDCYQKNSI